MDKLLEMLCGLLDEELERQETVVAVARAQGVAARAYDVDALQAKNAALETLALQAEAAVGGREAVVAQVATGYGLGKQEQTLSAIIEHVESPWSERLVYFQERLGATLRESRSLVESNMAFMQRSSSKIGSSLSMLVPAADPNGDRYDAGGRELAMAGGEPAFLDQKG